MWCLVGNEFNFGMDPYKECNCETYITPDIVVATFDTKEEAKLYRKWAKLKNPQPYRRYRRCSLLSIYEYVSIEKYVAPNKPPHNPSMGK